MRIAVIGAGLFGCVIAETLARLEGHSVTIIDNHRATRGSDPAACLIKPSWINSMISTDKNAALDLLNVLYGVQDIQFAVPPTRALATVHWVDPARVLNPQSPLISRLRAAVTGIWRNARDSKWAVDIDSGEMWNNEFDRVVVAAGVWCNDILLNHKRIEVEGLAARAGAAFLWRDTFITQPFIFPWAPFRQVVGFNRGDGAWVSDGTAVKPESWDDKRADACKQRCSAIACLPAGAPEVLYGLRPYVPNAKPAYLQEHDDGVWVATGGAKNGTIAAAWCALRLRETFT